MSTPNDAKKQQRIAGLAASWSAVIEAALALPVDAHETPLLGAWSAHDIVAHLVGWDFANLEAVAAIRAGRLPAFYAEYDPDWRTFNTRLVARHKQTTLEQTALTARASHCALVEASGAIAAEEFSRDYGVRSAGRRRVTIAMLFAVEARDEYRHAEQIRAFAAQRKE